MTDPQIVQGPNGPGTRMAVKYRFEDADMDFFFVVALGWGAEGGLSVGQAFHVASQIRDGDADSWVRAFSTYGDLCRGRADDWLARGWLRQSTEMRLAAFASYRSAWQFAPVGETFLEIYRKEREAFGLALSGQDVPATFFTVPYREAALPGVFLKHANEEAPIVLVVGGADTGFEDTYLSVGRGLLSRGFSVALVDLPGQGTTMVDDLFWEVEAERPIAAIIDVLEQRFSARAGRIALLGCSLGGYFVTRAAGHDDRLAAVIASTAFPRPGEVFAAQHRAGVRSGTRPSLAAQRNHDVLFWKAGASGPQHFLERTSHMCSDPSTVTVPFLSIVGTGESPLMAAQAREWTSAIRSGRKDLVILDAATGADGHVQVNDRRRLAQEVSGWLGSIFAG